MKRFYLGVILSLVTYITQAQDALITGYVDSTCPQANGRVLEIYANGNVDFTGWQLQRQANGGGFSTSIDLSEFGNVNSDFLYLTNNEAVFTSEFPDLTINHILENTVISSNGDDAFQIVDSDGNIIDRFGEEGGDGSETAWEHENSYYFRTSPSTANGGNFDPSNWTFGAIDALNAEGLCNDGEAFGTTVPLGNFQSEQQTAVVNFDNAYSSQLENGSVNITVSVDQAPAMEATVNVSAMSQSTAMDGQHYAFAEETLSFGPETTTQSFTVELPDNADMETDRFLALELSFAENLSIGNDSIHVVYILDNESHAPEGENNLGIAFQSSYAIEGDNPGSEILAHDPNTERLFVMNSGAARVEILDFSNPTELSALGSIDLSAYGDEGTSVAFHGDIVAATAVPDAVDQNGTIVFMDTDGDITSTVEVGSLPDMITFSPDGTMLLVANEGEPNDDYSIDPEGSISIIDLSDGVENLTQDNVTTLDFNAFDDQQEELMDEGIRIFGPEASVSQDLEPEYITVSEDSQMAWAALQENNAMAMIDLNSMEITNIISFGKKDHSLTENAFDSSNEMDFIFMSNWPVYGLFMPDGIANYTLNGTTYIVTANEGDARDYDTFEEEVDLEDISLAPDAFDYSQAFLEREENLGKLTFTNANVPMNESGEFTELHAFGGRSFSIFNGETGEMVYDSGDDFERITAEDPVYGDIFNTTDDENDFKDRSDNKGPEPEAIIVKEINGAYYAFIGLERIGGFMVYDISNPETPVFEGYFNNRGTESGEDVQGDLAPESLVYVRPADNTDGKGYIVIANEVSATISVYSLENDVLGSKDFNNQSGFLIYPNPVQGSRVFFNKPQDIELFTIKGQLIRSIKDASYLNVDALSKGVYILKNAAGQTQELVID